MNPRYGELLWILGAWIWFSFAAESYYGQHDVYHGCGPSGAMCE